MNGEMKTPAATARTAIDECNLATDKETRQAQEEPDCKKKSQDEKRGAIMRKVEP